MMAILFTQVNELGTRDHLKISAVLDQVLIPVKSGSLSWHITIWCSRYDIYSMLYMAVLQGVRFSSKTKDFMNMRLPETKFSRLPLWHVCGS